jgi:hypothetical protein
VAKFTIMLIENVGICSNLLYFFIEGCKKRTKLLIGAFNHPQRIYACTRNLLLHEEFTPSRGIYSFTRNLLLHEEFTPSRGIYSFTRIYSLKNFQNQLRN